MGSSTSIGAAASTGDSSWVGRMQTLFRKNTGDGADTIFSVVGGYGWVTYFHMPSTFVPPPGRPLYQAGQNVDAALALNPDIIIINLPSNDIAAGFTKKEMMDNLRYLQNFIFAANPSIKLYVTTTQPRNDLTVAQRDSQRALVDSITNNFGLYSINFWDDLVTPTGNMLRDEVRHLGFPDEDYHLNNLGHFYIYTRAKDKNIFRPNTVLPLTLLEFKAVLKNNSVLLSWHTAHEDTGTSFEIQRSADGNNFITVHRQSGRGMPSQDNIYTWADEFPSPGKNFYRIKITEPAAEKYSKTITVLTKEIGLEINKLYKNNSSSKLFAELITAKSQDADINIVNLSGALIYTEKIVLSPPSKTYSFNIENLPRGQYFLNIKTNNKLVTAVFIK